MILNKSIEIDSFLLCTVIHWITQKLAPKLEHFSSSRASSSNTVVVHAADGVTVLSYYSDSSSGPPFDDDHKLV
jgi:hypothetical protein